MISETYRMWKLLVLCKNKMEDVHTVVLFLRRGPLKAVRNAGPCSIVACSNNNLYMQVPVEPLKLWYTNPRHIAVPCFIKALCSNLCSESNSSNPRLRWLCYPLLEIILFLQTNVSQRRMILFLYLYRPATFSDVCTDVSEVFTAYLQM